MRKGAWLAIFLGLLIVVGLPLAGNLIRRGRLDRCATDGVKIEPIYQVQIRPRSGQTLSFCCIVCAEIWLERSKQTPLQISVTDEVTGNPIDSKLAYYVRSLAVTNPTSQNRVHTFENQVDARRHADAHRGRLLAGEDRPFQRFEH